MSDNKAVRIMGAWFMDHFNGCGYVAEEYVQEFLSEFMDDVNWKNFGYQLKQWGYDIDVLDHFIRINEPREQREEF